MKPWWEMRVLIGLALALIGAVGLAVLAYVARTGATAPDGTPLWVDVIMGGALWGLLVFLWFGIVMHDRTERRIVATGDRGVGLIVARHDGGWAMHGRATLAVLLTYRGRTQRRVFWTHDRQWLRPGMLVELIADPKDPGHFLLRAGLNDYISTLDGHGEAGLFDSINSSAYQSDGRSSNEQNMTGGRS